MAMAQTHGPIFWRHERSGALRFAVEAYLAADREMTPEEIAAMRAYLRQWIEAPLWLGPEVKLLRRMLGRLTDRGAIDRWLDLAERAGIDPL